jgi:hypothetical protein
MIADVLSFFFRLFAGSVLLIISCLQEPRTPGPYVVNVERHFQNAQEEGLIGLAEAACPSIDALAGECAVFDGPDHDCHWWCDSFDGVLVPYAITAEAIQYYTELVHTFEAAAAEDPQNAFMLSASLSYSATIGFHETVEIEGTTFTRVYKVDMTMDWSDYCGPLCAMFFDKTRTVLLTESGEVVGIWGDGPTDFAVS